MKILTLLFSLLLVACGVHGAVQPSIGSTEMMKANVGRGTNTGLWAPNMTNGTAARLTGVTGRYPGNGTATWPIFGKTITFSQPQSFVPGDIIGGTASQATISGSNSPTSFPTRDPNMTAGFSGSAFEVYPRWLSLSEINGAVVASIDADGTYAVISGNSGYSGNLAWIHANGSNNFNSHLFDLNPLWGGNGWGLFNRSRIGAQGPVITVHSEVDEFAFMILPPASGGVAVQKLTNNGDYIAPNIPTQTLASAVAVVTTDGNGKFFESAVPSASGSGFPLTANANAAGFSITSAGAMNMTNLTSYVSGKIGNLTITTTGTVATAPLMMGGFNVSGVNGLFTSTGGIGIYNGEGLAPGAPFFGIDVPVSAIKDVVKIQTNFFLIRSNGLVGLWTLTPTERLSVQGSVTVATNLYVTNNLVFPAAAGGKIDFYQGAGYGIGVQSSLQFYSPANTTELSFGYGTSASFTKAMGIVSTNVSVSGVVSAHSVTGTNGFRSYGTATNVLVSATGLTNTLPVNLRVIGITGTSISMTVSSTNTYALGTITVPTHMVLQPGEYLVGTSVAVQGQMQAW